MQGQSLPSSRPQAPLKALALARASSSPFAPLRGCLQLGSGPHLGAVKRPRGLNPPGSSPPCLMDLAPKSCPDSAFAPVFLLPTPVTLKPWHGLSSELMPPCSIGNATMLMAGADQGPAGAGTSFNNRLSDLSHAAGIQRGTARWYCRPLPLTEYNSVDKTTYAPALAGETISSRGGWGRVVRKHVDRLCHGREPGLLCSLSA